jgi:hypothetical protein
VTVALKSSKELERAFLAAYESVTRVGGAVHVRAPRQGTPSVLLEAAVPLHPDVRKAMSDLGVPVLGTPNKEDSRSDLAFDIVTFCPVPLEEWQREAKRELDAQAAEWIQSLRRVRNMLNNRGMYPSPCLQLRMDLKKAVVVESLSIKADDYLVDTGVPGVSGEIYYLRRPFILWPTDAQARSHGSLTALPSTSQDITEWHQTSLTIPLPDLEPRSLMAYVEGVVLPPLPQESDRVSWWKRLFSR